MAVLTIVVVGVALGVLAASKHNAWFDTFSMSSNGLSDALDPRMRL
jgi:ABC-type dipeptide/oligopeptide/nickel transport system permease component